MIIFFSGGPVIRRNWDRDDGGDVFTLVGVVSGNPATCIRNTLLFPDLYTFIGDSKVEQLYFLLVLSGALIVKLNVQIQILTGANKNSLQAL